MHYAYMKKLSNEQSGSVIFRPIRLITLYYNWEKKDISSGEGLSPTHAFNWILLNVKFVLTSYEELTPALQYILRMFINYLSVKQIDVATIQTGPVLNTRRWCLYP